MKTYNSFFKSVSSIAIPVALQSMLQSSFSIIDQIMIGQLGSVSIAGVRLAGKFSGIYSVLVAAFGAVASIMISQYLGQKNDKEVKRSYYLNLVIAIAFASFFSLLCLLLPQKIMGLYIKDTETIAASASYLTLLSGTFLPLSRATLLAPLFRCTDRASLPLYASIIAALTNTVLNYILMKSALHTPSIIRMIWVELRAS